MKKPSKNRPAKELTDDLIESGADLSGFMHGARVVPALFDPLKVNVDFPAWVVQALDREADRIGVPRQSLIKVWIVERLQSSQPGLPGPSARVVRAAKISYPKGRLAKPETATRRVQ